MKISILEDNKVYLKKLKSFLEDRWHKVITYNTIEKFEFIESDIYLVDLQIGKEMSFDLIKDIRYNTNSMIIIISHHTKPSILRKGIEYGADYYFNKMNIDQYSLQFEIIENLSKRLWKL